MTDRTPLGKTEVMRNTGHSKDKRPTFVVIAGPTATGKTALALNVAHRFGGEVVNADSIQLYHDLPTLTARPTPKEQAAAPHHLYAIHGPWQETSAMTWRTMAMEAMAHIHARGHVPIVTGGTGLYLNALLDGLSPIPDVPAEIRQKWRDWVAEAGATAAHDLLKERDPDMAARLRPSDTQRNTRALEVLEATGRSLHHWQSLPPREPGLRAQAAVVLLTPPREWIITRCHQRFDLMMAAGAADEVAALLATGVTTQAPVFRTLGAREIAAAQQGQLPWDQATEAAKIATRQYAKRQANWFRTQIGPGHRCDAQDSEILLCNVSNYLVDFGLTMA